MALILSTWSFGQRANAAAWPILSSGGNAVDAVETACRDAESDENNPTVGRGGLPDRTGEITLDALLMLAPHRRGGVCNVRHHTHPISIARLVMEKTPHALIAGHGAEKLARDFGVPEEDPMTDAARADWRAWLAGGGDATPVANMEEGLRSPKAVMKTTSPTADRRPPAADPAEMPTHDTIGVIARDDTGLIAGGCTTSGIAYKLAGRVGDSPLIGHGLYVDPRYGAAVTTGHGELVMGVCGSFAVVDELRRGATVQQAARRLLERVADTFELTDSSQIGLIVMAADGTWCGASLRPGFRVAVRTTDRDELAAADVVLVK